MSKLGNDRHVAVIAGRHLHVCMLMSKLENGFDMLTCGCHCWQTFECLHVNEQTGKWL